MKKIIKLVAALLVLLLVVKFCTDRFGGIISLPGSSDSSSSEDTGGWFSPKEKTNTGTVNQDIVKDIEDLERELGVGSNKGSSTTTTTIPSSTPSTSSSPLSFKGIPMTGSLTAFGNELVKAGFRSAGSGTYTGDFAGYSGCKVTPTGGSQVQEVRVDFPVISDWDSLEKAYDSLQASLTQKYGMEPKTSAGSNLAVYDLPNGTISLDADVSNRSTWHVILKYSNDALTIPSNTSGRNPIDDL